MACAAYPNVVLVESRAVTALFTVIRDKNCSTKDYITHSDRLMRILSEEGLAPLARQVRDAQEERAPDMLDLDLGGDDAALGAVLAGVGHGVPIDGAEESGVAVHHGQHLHAVEYLLRD